METINIINNLEQSILLENILILNQKKLLDLILDMFENDFGLIPSISENLTIDKLSEYFNNLSFINWNLFIKLINLKTPLKSYSKFGDEQHVSLIYILNKIISHENYSTNLIEILLNLPKGMIDWNVKNKTTKNNTLMILLGNKKFKKNTNIIKYILESNLFDESMWYEKNIKEENAINFILNYPEEMILKAFELNKFDFNYDLIIYKNGLKKNFRPINFFIEKQYLTIVKKLFSSDLIDLKYNYDKRNTNKEIFHIINTSICWSNNLEIFKLAIEYGLNFINPYNKNIETEFNNWSMWNASIDFIKKEEIILFLLKNNAIELNNKLLTNVISNNWVNILKIYFDSNFLKSNDLDILEEFNILWTTSILFYNKHYEYCSILFFKLLKTYYENLTYNLNQEYIDRYGFLDEDNKNL